MKRNQFHIICLLLFFITIIISCRQSYEPAVIKSNKNYLVVEGVINSGVQAVTTIHLSRTRNVTDSFVTTPELGAHINILAKSGSSYTMHEQGNGMYVSDALTLNASDEYALQINTANNSTYISAYTPVKKTPAIDSIHWEYGANGVTLFANTHDPQNSTRYYRWDYTETWEYHAFENAELSEDNGLIFYDVPVNRRYICYQSFNSTNILLGSSINLAQDVISNDSLTRIPLNDIRIGVRYSILLKQYALSAEGYEYWQLLQKNTQQLGSLFDAQPTQLTGNVTCVSNPAEPVIGYVSASSVEEKRLFITNEEVPGWQKTFQAFDCSPITLPVHPDNFLIYDYADTSYAPYYYSGSGATSLLIVAKKSCIDCTWFGGTTTKPSFW